MIIRKIGHIEDKIGVTPTYTKERETKRNTENNYNKG
jgi:hypothetical protein